MNNIEISQKDPFSYPESDFKKLPSENKIELLKRRVSYLNDICNTLNPYAPITIDMQKKLQRFHIKDLNDPFSITNKIVVMLENSVEDMHQLEKEIIN